MLILLFDIDGTLMLSGGAGRVAMERCMRKLHGEYREVDIPVHGRTDRAIVADLMEAHDIVFHESIFEDFYANYVQELEAAMHQCEGRLLPGVITLMNHLSTFNEQIGTGILTGNGQVAAQIKLKHFDIDHYFDFGGYGESTPYRNQIAELAMHSAGEHFDLKPEPSRTWIIGDTIHDVSCARSIDANVLAVGTGTVDIAELKASGPDVFMDDLTDIDQFMDSIEFQSKLT